VSRSVDLFIESAKPIEEVAAEVARLTRLNLTPGSVPGTWSLDQGTVHAELHAHPYVDDGELAFERYQYALSARVADRGRSAESSEANLLRMVSESLRKGRIPSLLVHDLQYRDGRAGPAPSPEGPDQAEAPEPGPASEPPEPSERAEPVEPSERADAP
jgi:hypothetical protein